MADCCVPGGYAKFFGKRTARKDARRYRRKGLDETARRMADFLRSRGVEGLTILEIGGGVGAIQLELLKAGAERSANLELSPAYEEPARELLREAGLEDRAEWRLVDVVKEGQTVEPADAVIMHRVVCCYPAPEALVGAAAERARRYLVMSFPRDRRAVRVGMATINLFIRLMRRDFRGWVHPPAVILGTAERLGLRIVLEHRGHVWQLAAFERV